MSNYFAAGGVGEAVDPDERCVANGNDEAAFRTFQRGLSAQRF